MVYDTDTKNCAKTLCYYSTRNVGHKIYLSDVPTDIWWENGVSYKMLRRRRTKCYFMFSVCIFLSMQIVFFVTFNSSIFIVT